MTQGKTNFSLSRKITNLGTENAFKLGEDIGICQARGLDVIKFNIGEPDFDSVEQINQVAIDEIKASNSHYCDPAGIESLRKTIASYITETRGVTVDPSRIVILPGAKPAISYTMMTYLDPGDEVIYTSPGFPIYESWVEYLGLTPVPLMVGEEKGFSFGAEDLKNLITERTKLIILCSPSNPTGGVLSKREISEIATTIRQKCRPDVRVFADEIYESILFDGQVHQSIIEEEGMEEITVLSSGFSKSFAMTGWRLGWVLLPTPEEAAIFKQLNINLVSCVPPFIQEAGREALENPKTQLFIKAMVKEFERRRNWIVPALNGIEGVKCQMPKGAFYVFPNIENVCKSLGIMHTYASMTPEMKSRTSPSGMFQMFLLYRYGIATLDRNSFGSIGTEGQHFIRLSIATKMRDCQRGLRRIQSAATDQEGFSRFLEEEKLWQVE